jgi:hypothetical protein
VLPELYRQRQGSEYDATQNVQNALDQISQAYTGVQNQNVQNEIAARQDAANRATTAALQSGYGPGANSGNFAPTTSVGPPIMPKPGAPSIADLYRNFR